MSETILKKDWLITKSYDYKGQLFSESKVRSSSVYGGLGYGSMSFSNFGIEEEEVTVPTTSTR